MAERGLRVRRGVEEYGWEGRGDGEEVEVDGGEEE